MEEKYPQIRFDFIVPKIYCQKCKCHILSGYNVYSYIEKWGSSIIICEKCTKDINIPIGRRWNNK